MALDRTPVFAETATELRALLDAAVDAIIIIDSESRILEFNAAAQRLFGYEKREILGRDVKVLMPEPDGSRHSGYVARYLRTCEARIIGIGREVEALKADGSRFPVFLSVGEVIGPKGRRFIGTIRDLSAQKNAEAEARMLQSRLAHVGRFGVMGEMVAGLAHELNQPLSAIVTYAQAARRLIDKGAPENRELDQICDKIAGQAQRASQVISKLRDFIRKQEVKKEVLNLNEVVSGALSLVEADAHAEGIEVKLEYGADLPLVRGDAIQLQQVLLNLTRNAVDAMKHSLGRKDGIVVRTQALVGDGKRVEVTVADHGPGVPEQLVEGIFHPFVTTKADGLGVGLAISRTIARAHGGDLYYRPNPEGGAVFGLVLPADTEE
jgi:two-component system sensor kinase FixL